MDTVPGFNYLIKQISESKDKKDALAILKHCFHNLSEEEKELLYDMLCLFDLAESKEKHALKKIHAIQESIAKHPEVVDAMKKFYSKVITPASSKDHFKNDRVRAAAALEKCTKELIEKNILPRFEIKRIA